MADQAATEYDKLNPAVQGVQENQFLNYSKMQDFGTATGDLFKNLGETVKGAVQGVDTWIKESIRTDATNQVDTERDRTQNWLQGGDVPADVKSSIQNNSNLVGNLQIAKGQGQISEAYYQMRLDTISRDLRSRYPGYREHIDNVMHDLTGVTPANKVIQDLFHSANSKSDPEQQLNAHLVKEYIDVGGGQDIANYRQMNGANPPNNYLMQKVGDIKGAVYRVNAEKAKIELDAQSGTLAEHDAARVARTDVRTAISQSLTQGGGLFGDAQKFRQQMADIEEQQKQGNVTLNPKQTAALLVQANNIDMKIKAQTEATLNSPIYSKYLKPDDRKAIVDEMTNLSSTIRAGLGEGGKVLPGQLGLAGSVLDHMGKADSYNLLAPDETLRKAMSVQKMFGHESLSALLTMGSATQPQTDSTFSTQNVLRHLSNAKLDLAMGNTTLPRIAEAAAADKNAPPGSVKQVIDSSKTVILDKSKTLPDEKSIAQLATGLYSNGSNFINTVKQGDRQRVYADLASPEMSKRMLELKDNGQPELYDNYKKWINETGQVLTRTEMTSMIESSQGLLPKNGVMFDPTTNRFTAQFAPGQTSMATGPANRLNNIIAPLVLTMQQDGAKAEDITSAVGDWVRNAGTDFDSMVLQPPQEGRQGTGASKATTLQATQERPPTASRSIGNEAMRPTPKDESRIAPNQTYKLPEADIAPKPTDTNTLTESDKAQSNPYTTNDLHIGKYNGKYFIIPNQGKSGPITRKEVADYVKDRSDPAAGVGFDDPQFAIKRMEILQKLRDEKPEKYKSFGAQ